MFLKKYRQDAERKGAFAGAPFFISILSMKYFLIFIFFTLTLQAKLLTFPLKKNHTLKQHNAFAKNVMIATQGEAATKAGLEMIKAGGNIYDAAVAVSFVISVERPQSTGIGGGGFMLIDGPDMKSPKAFDFREVAPGHAHYEMFLDHKGNVIRKKSLDGILSIGVPGLVDGVLRVHEKYGRLPLEKVIAPAIKLAEEGFIVYPHLAMSLEYRKDVLRQYKASMDIFFVDGRPLREGERLIQKDLARTLKTIAKKGRSGFYKGWVANRIISEMKKRKGVMTHRDLTSYESKWRKPVASRYDDYEIYSMSPPSSGGSHIIQIFNLLKPLSLHRELVQGDRVIHKTASAMELAFIDRARYMGDSDFVNVPVKGIISKGYANQLRPLITEKALSLKGPPNFSAFPFESSDTTHFTIMDKDGNTISSTQTINFLMGSGLVVPGTGIVMNDEMDDFAAKVGAENVFGAVGGRNNLVEPRKRPLSSMSPTIIRRKGKPFFSLGTPSGTRILTCVAQVAFNYLEHGLDLYHSVAATRFHHQWRPKVLQIGYPYFSNKVMMALEKRGHVLKKKNLGCKVQAIALENGLLHGVSDPRGEGLALGI